MCARGENGWQSEKTLLECNRYMLDNEVATDVCFEVGPPDGATINIRAHKYMLISRSPVFEAMFSSGMTECSNVPEKRIRIEDINPTDFRDVLNYIYCEIVTATYETALPLMYAAKKYMLPRLVQECGKCLRDFLNIENACHILEHSILFDDEELEANCLKFIAVNSEHILVSREFLCSPRQVVQAILQTDKLWSSESSILDSCISWAKFQLRTKEYVENPTDQQIRETLGSLLYLIRFPTMTDKEFAQLLGRSGLLSGDEKSSIYYYIITKEMTDEFQFHTQRRRVEELWVDRALTSNEHNWFYESPTADAIDFKTGHDILLTGIGLYPGKNASGYTVDVEVLEQSECLVKKTVIVPETKGSAPFRVSLDQSVSIKAGVVYTVIAFAHGSIGFYGNCCQASCKSGNVIFIFSKPKDPRLSANSTSETIGQIPRLYFTT